MCGGHTEITKDGKHVFHQIITSGVAMRAPDKIDFLLTKYHCCGIFAYRFKGQIL
jgi:hypothetical protein